MTCFWVIANCE